MDATVKTRIEFAKTDFSELEDLVRLGFGNDPELLLHYQQLDTDFNVTVKRNLDNISEGRKLMSLSLFKIVSAGKVVGFFVADVNAGILYSFGVNIIYRTRQILTDWFIEMAELFDGIFSCSLWSKNSRAINFLIKNGMRITSIDGDIVNLIYS